MHVALDAGAYADPDDKPGTANLAAAMLTRGTASHSYRALAEQLDRLAIDLGGSATMDGVEVNAGSVTEQSRTAAALLAEVVTTPTFPAEELTDLVAQMRTGLAIQEKSPEYAAERELRRRMYPGHPYQRTPEGTAEDLDKIASADLAGWWRAYARPDAAVFYLAGDIDAEAGFALATSTLGGWHAEGPRPVPHLPALTAPGATRIYLVDRKSDQAQIRIGQPGALRSDADWPAVRVLSDAFGGGFDSRLNTRIRVQEGLTYGASGSFRASRFAGSLVISTFSKNATVGKTVAAAVDELRRLKASPPAGEERTLATGYLLGSYAGQRETPDSIVADLETLRASNLPADWFDRYLDGIAAASDASLAEVARRRVDPDHIVIVVVGDAAALEPQLKSIAPVELVTP